LEKLKIRYGDGIGYIRADNLRKLEIDDEPLSLIEMPQEADFRNTVSTLSVTRKGFEMINRTSDSDDMQKILYLGAKWTKLEEVTWELLGALCGLYTASLPFLTTVILPPQDPSTPFIASPINSLCLEILDTKGACPSLRTIESASYPCWSLLFTMLEERLVSPNVRPIDTIRLPGFPVAPILRLLTVLLVASGAKGQKNTNLVNRNEKIAHTASDIDVVIQKRADTM
jgi:hypothetical protein